MKLENVEKYKIRCFNCGYLMTNLQAKQCEYCEIKLIFKIPKEYENMTFEEINSLIKKEFFRLEQFLKNRVDEEMKFFDFNKAFTKFFAEIRLFKNQEKFNINSILIDYFSYLVELTDQVNYRINNDGLLDEIKNSSALVETISNLNYLLFFRAHEFFMFSEKEVNKEISIKKVFFDNGLKLEGKGKKLTLKQIALIHAYSGETITDHNKNDIAVKNGWTSGHKLKQLFDQHYYRRVDRIGLENTLKKTKNKIELIESIIDLLPKDKQQQALDEVRSLENAKDTEYL